MTVTRSPDLPDLEPAADPWALPPGVRLLHIGPPKTGTTALQAALFAARPALAAQGVRHAGTTRHPDDEVRAVLRRPSFRHRGNVPPRALWLDLAREIRRAREPRVILSSEFLAGADREAIERIVADLGPTNLHIVATLRPLTSLLPSQWQQDLRRGSRDTFDAWLDNVLDPAGRAIFWRDHRVDRILGDWSAVVGPANVTAVALDRRDAPVLFRSFERLLALAPGTLAPASGDNRSLTLAEAEAVRLLNELALEGGVAWPAHARLVHLGAAQELWRQAPDPADPRVDLPARVVDRALDLEAEMLAGIRAHGVRILGDTDDLLARPGRAGGELTPEMERGARLAARMAMGVIRSAGHADDPTRPEGVDGASVALGPFPARVLTRVLFRRALRYGGRLLRRVGSRTADALGR